MTVETVPKYFLVAIVVAAIASQSAGDTAKPEVILGYGAQDFGLTFRSGMKAQGIRFRGSRFVGQDLRNSVFDDCDFTDVSFSECDLRGVSFKRCNMTGALMGGQCKLNNAILEDAIIREFDATLTPDQFESTYSFKAKDLRGCRIPGSADRKYDFRGQNLDGATILGDVRQCVFTDALIPNVIFGARMNTQQLLSTKSFKRRELVGITFRSFEGDVVDFSNVNLWSSSLRSMRNVSLGGADISRCSILRMPREQITSTDSFQSGFLDTVYFNQIDFSGTNFDRVTLSRCVFFRCDFTDATFTDAVLSGCRFDACTGLTEEQFQATWNAKHERMDSVK